MMKKMMRLMKRFHLQIEMQKVKINCIVTSRIAHTVMTSTALNKANISQEFYFEVELPKTAFITNFSMEIETAGPAL
ncbi:inter-alpha-trypsin inhibitor heavy chain H3-like [Hemibagrus wyckioides]|uniref:inter-alpha-trypsin inhibitor heavy chain H3-like n=1 Tax=Hemibagrus wyckioides TaxID=337641 RepID=UPI00266CB716|nr:inter-alpha-trypsin inhibitor heavy chain H3-like [Hemibagrus wyckioides]